ncbi:LOW QUALITY PROTEIN: uncharacterized protein LOC103697559 [Phoenix dactylifera]|uniref:LOW QUALITY PROTEIN: uncharacterized protein LOC103697559 n=1 Tax=Phoenix dactylifera TaxID=42345 RepID=A0A8B9AK82_PHODC|nr:LOW QUALITY PROTEIN: uncharacterized protein LOC103697559 [Phoenix dactylifera]
MAAARSGGGGERLGNGNFEKIAKELQPTIIWTAVAAAKNAAKGITDMELLLALIQNQLTVGRSLQLKEILGEHVEHELRNSALDKLEQAMRNSFFGQQVVCREIHLLHHLIDMCFLVTECIDVAHEFLHLLMNFLGLKVLDSSMENFASGAWQALGSAWKGSSNLVHKLEHSASNLAESIQQGGLPGKATTLAPSIMETGKSFTLKGIKVLEQVGKETMDLLISETGLEVEKDSDAAGQQVDDEQFEEVTFDRCFYIYGGPDQLEELEALSNHHALLFNRRKTKLSSEQKSSCDGKLRQIQQIFSLGTEFEENGVDSDKGKNIEMVNIDTDVEMKKLRDSSVSKAADMAAGFTSALGGLAANEIIQRTSDRLETVHSEGVHRLSELCCFAVSQLLILGKSVIFSASKLKSEETFEDTVKIEWPEDSVSKAKIIRFKAQSMSGDVETVYNSFSTGISDIVEAYLAAIQSVSSDTHGSLPQQNKIQEKANAISEHLHADRMSALDKIQDALQYLAYVVLSTSMPTV